MNRFATCMLLTLIISACGAPASENPAQPAANTYAVHYKISLTADRQAVEVEMSLEQSAGQLIEYSFNNPGEHLSNLTSNGKLNHGTDRVSWQPSSNGGLIRWQIDPVLERNGKGFDALMTAQWAIFRAEDIIPRARTRSVAGTSGVTTISFDLPLGWSSVSEYTSSNGPVKVERPGRRFLQPTGWIAIGDLGVRRESIAGTQVSIAAPRGEHVRRLDMLALLNWTMPELVEIREKQLPRLTIISAGDPMWRGGLSAPSSMFIHADRPLISENGTSTLMHELVHIAFDIQSEAGFDWIIEGLAEYYSIELLRRGSAITKRRYKQAMNTQEEWASQASGLCGDKSTGPVTARAVTVLDALNREISTKTKRKSNLDDVVRQLSEQGQKITLTTLRATVKDILNSDAESLDESNLPGCE